MLERVAYWYINSLRAWRKQWQPTKADRYRLKILEGTAHPVAPEQRRLIEFKEKMVGWIEAEIGAAEDEAR